MVFKCNLLLVTLSLCCINEGICDVKIASYSTQLTVFGGADENAGKSLAERSRRDLPEPTVAYYDFLVNEFSFKVWAVFEMVTIGLLFYSTFAAIYYARWTYLRQNPADDGGDWLLRRSHERLLRALGSPPT
ncbi:Hypothetical protein NTJ_04458 [Nesidiocoris tenuis]|uniref:Uncharacterized protein n=1 Tax=Nesidiocoris tenuis TaxID=355587 RepID=A0ABN7AL72_9HEMI|nr:Hypothetical protein NTJ_04458 [Nesidiocoris tenuis]